MDISFFLKVFAMFLIPLVAVMIPVYIGERYGIYHKKKDLVDKDFPVGTVVSVALGLFGFMLAFTFGIAANRYDLRKQALLDETLIVRTTYLRAGLIPEPYRSDTKKLLVEYIDLRVDLSANYSKLNQSILRSQQILDSLWLNTEALAAQDRSSEVYSLYTTSVNDLFDLYNQRITLATVYRIPVAILWSLFIIEFLSMLIFGYHFGMTGRGSFQLNLLVAIIFSVVMFLIFALDRPETGLTPLSQQPMLNLQKELHAKQSTVSTPP
jgi:hypothetical protein